MIVILIPSQFEAKDFIAELEDRRKFRTLGAECVEGRAGETAVTVGIIGMGPPHAAKRAKAVLDELKIQNLKFKIQGAQETDNPNSKLETRPFDHAQAAQSQVEGRNSKQIRGVILCGFAGALKPGLARGDIFVTAGAEHFLPHLPEAERPAEARLHTADAVVSTEAAKAELHARTGAWLVDMEQADIARVVADAGLPFVGLRIVSDEAHENLPHDLLSRAYDQAEGEYTPLRLAGHLTRNPFKVRKLASFVLPLPPVRKRMSEHLHKWLKLTGPKLFARQP